MISQAYRYGLWRFPKHITSCKQFLKNAADRGHEVALAYLKYSHDEAHYREKSIGKKGKYVQALTVTDRTQVACLLKDHYEQTGDVFALMELYYQSLGGYAVSKELVNKNHKAALYWFFKQTNQTVDVKYLAAWYEHIDVYEQQDGIVLEHDEAIMLISYFAAQKQLRRSVKVVLLTSKWIDSYFDWFFTMGPKTNFFIYWKAIVKRKFHLMPGDDQQKREHIENVHKYYNACITNAKRATLAWLLCATKRLGICKDVARLIGKKIWRSRKNPDYWNWEKVTSTKNKKRK